MEVTTSAQEYRALKIRSDKLVKEIAKEIKALVVGLMRKQGELQREQEAVLDQMDEEEIESAMATLRDNEIYVGAFEEVLQEVLERI
jgi:hypothetical protein